VAEEGGGRRDVLEGGWVVPHASLWYSVGRVVVYDHDLIRVLLETIVVPEGPPVRDYDDVRAFIPNLPHDFLDVHLEALREEA